VISWIVATHDRQILERSLLPTIPTMDELVVVEDAPSIAVAYNQGTAQASHRIKVYVHHDVAILDAPRLRESLFQYCNGVNGIIGVIGSLDRTVPWWNGNMVGSVVDTRLGPIGPGGEGTCAYLDGLLLATAQELTWDETYTGWHLYDHDICQQMLAAGLPNVYIPGGKDLVRHETSGPRNVNHINGWADAVDVFRQKWPEVQHAAAVA
jgi:hypothetical protein